VEQDALATVLHQGREPPIHGQRRRLAERIVENCNAARLLCRDAARKQQNDNQQDAQRTVPIHGSPPCSNKNIQRAPTHWVASELCCYGCRHRLVPGAYDPWRREIWIDVLQFVIAYVRGSYRDGTYNRKKNLDPARLEFCVAIALRG